jgi:hypothetical protein
VGFHVPVGGAARSGCTRKPSGWLAGWLRHGDSAATNVGKKRVVRSYWSKSEVVYAVENINETLRKLRHG